MDARWLEDFIALASTKSFTRAAELCCSSQSAMSRRIQSLERWVEAPLIDRDAHPIQLTEAGERFLAVAIGLRGTLEAARQIGRGRGGAPSEPLRLLVQPDLHPSFLIDMLVGNAQGTAPLSTRLDSSSVEQSVALLCDGEADLLVLQQHRSLPALVDPLRFQSIVINTDSFGLYGPTDASSASTGRSLSPEPLALLAYKPTAYFAQVAAMVARDDADAALRRCVCEADSVMAVLAFVKAGLGVGFLPGAWAADDVRQGHIRPLDPRGQCELEIRVVRENSSVRRMASQQRRQALEVLWRRLEASQRIIGSTERSGMPQLTPEPRGAAAVGGTTSSQQPFPPLAPGRLVPTMFGSRGRLDRWSKAEWPNDGRP